MLAILVIDNQRWQAVLFIERNDRQQGVARQRKVLGDVDAPVAVTVFLPNVMVALVMVFVFDAPMGPRRPSEAHSLVGRKARYEASGVLVLVFGTGFLHPLAPDFDRTVRR